MPLQGSVFRVQGSGFRVQGSGFRVQGSGSRRRQTRSSTRPPFALLSSYAMQSRRGETYRLPGQCGSGSAARE